MRCRLLLSTCRFILGIILSRRLREQRLNIDALVFTPLTASEFPLGLRFHDRAPIISIMTGSRLLSVFLFMGEEVQRGMHRRLGGVSSHGRHDGVHAGAGDELGHDGVGADAGPRAELVLGGGSLQRFPDRVVFPSSRL